jgi:DNA-binding NarL/FixJ family response regulator
MVTVTSPRLRIDIVDGDERFARMIARTLETIQPPPRLAVWGSAGEYRRRQEETRRVYREILIFETELPDGNGVDLLVELAGDATPPRERPLALALTRQLEPSAMVRALQLGAAGYLLKSEMGNLCRHLTVIMDGGAVLSPTAARAAVEILRALPDAPSPGARLAGPPVRSSNRAGNDPLTRREAEILQMIVRGLSAPETAAALHISHHTVRVHVKHIYRKLRVTNRAQALGAARELGYF